MQCDYSVTGNSTLLNVSSLSAALLLRCTRKRAMFSSSHNNRDWAGFQGLPTFLHVAALALSGRIDVKFWDPCFCICVTHFGTQLWVGQSTHSFGASTPYAASTIYTNELEAGKRRVTLHRPCEQLVNNWPAEFKQELLVNVPLNYVTCIIIKSWLG